MGQDNMPDQSQAPQSQPMAAGAGNQAYSGDADKTIANGSFIAETPGFFDPICFRGNDYEEIAKDVVALINAASCGRWNEGSKLAWRRVFTKMTGTNDINMSGIYTAINKLRLAMNQGLKDLGSNNRLDMGITSEGSNTVFYIFLSVSPDDKAANLNTIMSSSESDTCIKIGFLPGA